MHVFLDLHGDVGSRRVHLPGGRAGILRGEVGENPVAERFWKKSSPLIESLSNDQIGVHRTTLDRNHMVAKH